MADPIDRVRTLDPFAAAETSLRGALVRPELDLTEIKAPEGLAPHATAFAADVHTPQHLGDALGTGRFIVLHDPSEPEPWAGPFRIVCYAQAPLEHDIGADPMLPDVAWSWLIGALHEGGAELHAASGTATTVLSTGFGELADQGAGAQIEFRASWSPDDLELGIHLAAWGQFLCALAGLPPSTDGVALLAPRRGARDR